MPSNPYSELPAKAFWRSGVAMIDTPVAPDIYTPKWSIARDMKIATAGSCFAQHIGRYLRAADFDIMDVEPAPQTLSPARHMTYGYGIYSGRYGNVYTVRQMLQLAREALGETPQRDVVWEKDGRWYDGLRPTIEPDGLSSKEAVIGHRAHHLARVRQMLLNMDMMIFTLGLTEAWIERETGMVFPICPGIITDDFDPDLHVFHNFTFTEIRDDLIALRALLQAHRPEDRPLKFMLTVSPVPLTATATDKHVQVATVYSKSVLRTVAGEVSDMFADVDYFPSYEIVTSPWSQQVFFGANLRAITAEGVAHVMASFMAVHAPDAAAVAVAAQARSGPDRAVEEDEEMLAKCDEDLLDAFGGRDP